MSEFKRAELSAYQQHLIGALCDGAEVIITRPHEYVVQLPPDDEGPFAPWPLSTESVEQLISKGILRQASDAAPATTLVLTAWSEQCF